VKILSLVEFCSAFASKAFASSRHWRRVRSEWAISFGFSTTISSTRSSALIGADALEAFSAPILAVGWFHVQHGAERCADAPAMEKFQCVHGG
jgi:hypothetical protein